MGNIYIDNIKLQELKDYCMTAPAVTFKDVLDKVVADVARMQKIARRQNRLRRRGFRK